MVSESDPRPGHILGKALLDTGLQPLWHHDRATDQIDGSPSDGRDDQRNNQQRPFGRLPKSFPLGGTGGWVGVWHERPAIGASWVLSFAKPD